MIDRKAIGVHTQIMVYYGTNYWFNFEKEFFFWEVSGVQLLVFHSNIR